MQFKCTFAPLTHLGMNLIVKVKRLHPEAPLPVQAYPGDAGFDLHAWWGPDVHEGDRIDIPPLATVVIPTGIALEFPIGWRAILKDRSSMAARGLFIGGGVIDAGYRGEILVVLTNMHRPYDSDREHPPSIYKGDRIAQVLFERCPIVELEEVEELSPSPRGEKGFGSSGK